MPYSHKDRAIVDLRMKIFSKYCSDLLSKGEFPISPLYNDFVLQQFPSVKTDWKTWKDYSTKLLCNHTTEMHILCVPGWSVSEGVIGEMEIATNFGIPIKFIEMDLSFV